MEKKVNIDNNILGVKAGTIARPKANEAQEQEVKEAVTQSTESQKKERRGRKRKEKTDLSASNQPHTLRRTSAWLILQRKRQSSI